MIYLLSDLHGDFSMSGLKEYLSLCDENDLLIILGDIGLAFENTELNRKFTDSFLAIDKKIAFVDGNHENFDYLYSFPEEEWNGGQVHRLTENIVHLKRGYIYTIEEKTFFVFGGCKSSAKWKEMGLWYPQEEPGDEEYIRAYQNLQKLDFKVDYVLTHKYTKSSEPCSSMLELQALTDFIDDRVKFKRWYAGHWHQNRRIDEKHILVYDKLHMLE